MQNEKRNNKVIVLFLIISFFLILPFILIYLQLTSTPVYSSLFYGYISSGHSIFIPFLPIINLFPYLPIPSNMSGFTLGHLVDIIIIINLCTLLDTTLYHYVKVVFISKKLQMYFYIDFCMPIGSKDTEIHKLSSKPENYQSNIILLENDLGYHFNKIFVNIIQQDYKKMENLHRFFKYWKRKKTKLANFTKKLIVFCLLTFF